MTDHTQYALGAIPSPPDIRDIKYAVQSVSAEQAAELPAACSFVGHQQAMRNQGPEGACVGFALASGVMGYHESVQPSPVRAYARELSPRANYQDARTLEPVPGAGSYPRAALKAAKDLGIPLEEDWPYDAGNVGQEGPLGTTNRVYNRISSYHAVSCLPHALKAAMIAHGPLLGVIRAYDGFYAPDPVTGLVRRTGEARGAHAIAIVGYDDTRQAFHIRNSWGVKWGQGGYAWLPYSYALIEAWAVVPRLTEPPAPPPPPAVPWWMFWASWFK